MRASVGVAIYWRIRDRGACLPPVEPLILDEVREMLSSIRVEMGLDGSSFRDDAFVRSKLDLEILDVPHACGRSRNDRGAVAHQVDRATDFQAQRLLAVAR